jgi:hypothetical protein
MRLPVLLLLIPLAAGSAGCIVYPKKVEQYDTACQVKTKRLELDAVLIVDCNGVYGKDALYCVAFVAGAGVTTGVVSGSIVIVGNAYYRLDQERRCARRWT